jgi:hypothetical protein
MANRQRKPTNQKYKIIRHIQEREIQQETSRRK